MVKLADNFDCCGIQELIGIDRYSSPAKIIHDVADLMHYQDVTYIIFSSITKSGANLANYIRKHKLGVLKTAPKRINLNSDNELQVWLWTPCKVKLKKVKLKPVAQDKYYD